MNPLQKSMLKISQNYLNFNRFALTLFLCVTIMTSCTTTSSDEGTGVPPPVPSPLEVGDVTVVPSGGETSPYAAAIATIEGAVIVVSGITNLADVTTETLTVSIADRDNPATYTVEPSSIVVPATVLNPDGTNAAANRLEGVQFVLTPVAAGSETITYSIEVRLAEFVAPPPLPFLPVFAVEDITITPSGGDTSPYAAATPTIEGDTIVISGIANLADVVRTETTLTVSIADTDTPADYTAEPSSVIIPANVLNPGGTGVVNAVVPNIAFVLTPVAAGGTAVTFNVELRLDALAPLSPLEIADIAFDSGRDPAYSAAMVSSVTGNVITISGIKNKEDGFSVDLMLAISSSYRVTEQGTAITRADNALTLAGASLNPSGVARTITAMDDEGLSFTVTAAQSVSASEKYYVRLMLGDLIQLRLLGGNAGDFASEVVLSEGTSSSGMTATLKECSVVTGLPSHQVLVGGMENMVYTLTGTVNAYVASVQTDFVLTEGNTQRATFSVLVTSACTQTSFSGAGTSGDPYIIDSDRRLNLMAELIKNQASYRDDYYKVTERIDLGIAQAPWSKTKSTSTTPSGPGFAPMSTFSAKFSGKFDCDNNEIANLYINDGGNANVGLFGVVSNATIENCRLTAVEVIGDDYVGGLVGSNISSTINNSYVTGSVTGMGLYIGGLVGNSTNSTISNSYVVGSVTGNNTVGGLVGGNDTNSTITTSYASGAVRATDGSTVGGLVGQNYSMVSNSYATGSVSGNINVGGLVGVNNSGAVNASYAIGSVTGNTHTGGLVGRSISGGTVTDSYWDTTATSQSSSAGGTAQTTTQLQSATSYTGWDSAIWVFTPNNQYPRLKTVVCANRQYVTPVPTDCTSL
ncbi:hypothetical protein COTS27_01016 [Spirochaetota bacterium]|nr:hypothetical protein COTS27_01016 [Spirochaetota bacterium]